MVTPMQAKDKNMVNASTQYPKVSIVQKFIQNRLRV